MDSATNQMQDASETSTQTITMDAARNMSANVDKPTMNTTNVESGLCESETFGPYFSGPFTKCSGRAR